VVQVASAYFFLLFWRHSASPLNHFFFIAWFFLVGIAMAVAPPPMALVAGAGRVSAARRPRARDRHQLPGMGWVMSAGTKRAAQ
jgi:hypothetical protein